LDFRGFRYVKVTSTAAAPADLAVSLIVSP
jgi:hypothetical protein